MELNCPQSSRASRYLFLDALRGIAALGVVLHHARNNTVLALLFEGHTSVGLEAIFSVGALGVPVFFILSGFVIAHSLRNNSLTLPDVGNFMLRRQLRLDPAYWMTGVLMLSLIFIEAHVFKLPSEAVPNLGQLALTFLYLQDLAAIPKNAQFVPIAWTLCLEIQFYVLFLVLLLIGKRGKRIDSNECFTNVSVALVLLTGVACLAIKPFYVDAAWFFSHWYYFALGTLSYFAWKRIIDAKYFVGYSALFFFVALLAKPDEPNNNLTYMAMFVGLMTAWALYVAGISNQMTRWGENRVLQYLGKISYSLYLTHLFVLYVVLKGGYKITGENVPMAYLWLVAGVLCSIGFAHIFYLTIERTSLRFAERFKKAAPEKAESDSVVMPSVESAAIPPLSKVN